MSGVFDNHTYYIHTVSLASDEYKESLFLAPTVNLQTLVAVVEREPLYAEFDILRCHYKRKVLIS